MTPITKDARGVSWEEKPDHVAPEEVHRRILVIDGLASGTLRCDKEDPNIWHFTTVFERWSHYDCSYRDVDLKFESFEELQAWLVATLTFEGYMDEFREQHEVRGESVVRGGS